MEHLSFTGVTNNRSTRFGQDTPSARKMPCCYSTEIIASQPSVALYFKLRICRPVVEGASRVGSYPVVGI